MLLKLRLMMKRKEGQKGFTLIELIVVMAILAILAALAVPRFAHILGTSKDKAREQNHQLIESAADLYVANETTADNAKQTALSDDIDTDCDLYNKGYLKKIPKDPLTDKGYRLDVVVSGGVITSATVSELK